MMWNRYGSLLTIVDCFQPALTKLEELADREINRASDIEGSGLALSVSQPMSLNSYAVILLVVAIIAAVLGFAGTAAWIAKVFLVVFLVLFPISLASRAEAQCLARDQRLA